MMKTEEKYKKCPKTRTKNEFSDKLWRRVRDSNPCELSL